MKSAFVPSGDIDGGGAPVMPVTFGPHVLVRAPPRPPACAGGAPRPPRPRPPAPPPATGVSAGGVATTSRVFFTGSMTTFSWPDAPVRTYQKRPSGIQFTLTVSFVTR